MLEVHNIISLALVLPLAMVAFYVVRHYFPKVQGSPRAWTGEQFVFLGIIVSFVGKDMINGIFWGTHFLAGYLQLFDVETLTYKWGQFANVYSRNLSGIIAGLLHLGGAYKFGVSKVRHPAQYAFEAFLLFVAGIVTLLLLRP